MSNFHAFDDFAKLINTLLNTLINTLLIPQECIEVLRNMLFCLHQGMGVHLPLMCQAILHSLPPPHQPRLENTLLFYRNLLTTFRDCTYATELLQNTFISILNHLFGLLQTGFSKFFLDFYINNV